MSRNPAQSEAARERSATAIRSAGLELFAMNGYHGTTTADIAKAAGVSKGLVHNYYPSKEDLLISIVVEGLKAGREIDTQRFPKRKGIEAKGEQLRRLAHRAIARTVEQPHLYRLFFGLLLHPGMAYLLERVEDALGDVAFQEERDLLAAFKDSSDSTVDAILFQSALNGIALTILLRPEIFGEGRPLNADAVAERLTAAFAGLVPEGH